MHRILASRLLLLALLGSTAWTAQAEPPLRLTLLGEVRIESGRELAGTTLGGLSALVYDPQAEVYYALSDGPGQGGPARFYTLEIDLDDGSLDPEDVRFLTITEIRPRPEAEPFREENLDPEGLAWTQRESFFVSSEGYAEARVPPFVGEMARTGRMVRRFELPPAYVPRKPGRRGVRQNAGFESLTLTPSGLRLVAATENALAQDGPAATVEFRTACRWLIYDPESGEPLAEHLYWAEPVAEATLPPDGLAVAGLVELLAWDETRFLALERSYSLGRGNTIRLFLASIEDADDFLHRKRLGPKRRQRLQPVHKTLLLDLTTLDVELDNLEGMTWGPPLPDGRRTLVMISDDNFNPFQVTQILAFAVE